MSNRRFRPGRIARKVAVGTATLALVFGGLGVASAASADETEAPADSVVVMAEQEAATPPASTNEAPPAPAVEAPAPVDKVVASVEKTTATPQSIVATPKIPTQTDVCEPANGETNDKVTIPEDNNFDYKIYGEFVGGGADYIIEAEGVVVVEAVAKDGVTVKEGATTSWSFNFTKEACAVDPDPWEFRIDVAQQCVAGANSVVVTVTDRDGKSHKHGYALRLSTEEETPIIASGSFKTDKNGKATIDLSEVAKKLTPGTWYNVDLLQDGVTDLIQDTVPFQLKDCAVTPPVVTPPVVTPPVVTPPVVAPPVDTTNTTPKAPVVKAEAQSGAHKTPTKVQTDVATSSLFLGFGGLLVLALAFGSAAVFTVRARRN